MLLFLSKLCCLSLKAWVIEGDALNPSITSLKKVLLFFTGFLRSIVPMNLLSFEFCLKSLLSCAKSNILRSLSR